jgi:hypothetical protein
MRAQDIVQTALDLAALQQPIGFLAPQLRGFPREAGKLSSVPPRASPLFISLA